MLIIRKILIPLLLTVIFIFSNSCRLPRVVERSHKNKPEWVHGLERGYIITQGTGNTFNEAQENAFKMLRERVVSSVAVNVSSESQIEISERIIENISKYNENTHLRTVISTDFLNSLRGISLSKAEAFYWERKKYPKKTFKIHYHIKYPFSQHDMNSLIQEWTKMDKAFNAELDKLEKDIKETESVYDLISYKDKADALVNIFSGVRKTRAELLKLQAEQLLANLGLEAVSHERGNMLLKLNSMGRDFVMQSEVHFTSDCATIFQSKLIGDDKYLRIIYDPDFCYSSTQAHTFNVSQNYGEYTLFADYEIPQPDDEIRFVVSDPIRMNTSFSYSKQMTWIHIPIRVFTDIQFIITRIELVLNTSSRVNLRQILTGDDGQRFVQTEHNQLIRDKGDHEIRFSMRTLRNSELERFLSNFIKGSSVISASGTIYYRPAIEQQEQSISFNNINVIEYR